MDSYRYLDSITLYCYYSNMTRFRLAELAQATGTTTRTIRFYVAEGLLPPPIGAGPAAVYEDEHRDRLQLIALLKARYLPLKEIRRLLAGLSSEEVRAQLSQGAGALAESAPEALPAAAGPRLGDASAYLERVLSSRPAARESRDSGEVARRSHLAAPPASPPRAAPPLPRPLPRGDEREQWERITLADGVELHIRDDWRRTVGPLEALIRQARKLLGSE